MNGPHQFHLPSYRFSDEIPDTYEEPVLLVLPCNPFRLYVYWEHPAITAGAAAQWVLRYFPSDINGTDSLPEIKISSQSGEQFLDVPVPGAHYIVELVQVNADGVGTILLRSGHETPTVAAEAEAQTAPFQCRSADGLITGPAVQNTTPAQVPPAIHESATTQSPAPTPRRSPSSWALQVPGPS